MGEPNSLNKYLYCASNPINSWDPSGHSFISELTVSLAIRGGIAGAVFGLAAGGFTYAKTGSFSAALYAGVITGGMVGLSFISPLAAYTFGAIGVGTLIHGIATGAITADDIPELLVYVVLAVSLHATFSSSSYLSAEASVLPGVHTRLNIFYKRLAAESPARSPTEAMAQITRNLNAVEDMYTNIPFDENVGLNTGGRMYPPRSDRITVGSDGTTVAQTRGSIITIDPNGGITIVSRKTGKVVYPEPSE